MFNGFNVSFFLQHTPDLLPTPRHRTPKLLAPLDRRPQDVAALPALKHHVPLKPISRSPLCSRTWLRRQRLSQGSPRTGPLTTKGGSEESGSGSSQSSIDLDDEEEDLKFIGGKLSQHLNSTSPAEDDLVGLPFNVQPRIRQIPPIHRSAHNPDEEPINHASARFRTEMERNSHCEENVASMNNAQQGLTKNNKMPIIDSEEENNMGQTTEPEPEVEHGKTFSMCDDQSVATVCSEENHRNDLQLIEQPERTMKDFHIDNPISCQEDVKLLTPEERPQSFTSAVNLPQPNIHPKRNERMLKALTPARSKERRNSTTCERRANIQTNQQSFNILAHKDQSILNSNKSKNGPKCSSLSTQVKDKTRKSPELIINGEPKVKSKIKAVKGTHCSTGTPSPRKMVTDHAQSKRSSPDKLSSNNAQKHPAVKELKGTQQLKRSSLQSATPRSKSAADFITYKDMFRQIQSGADGPAIYEMFAGPVYDNLRVSSSCDKVTDRQVQSAKIVHKPLKQALSKMRRSPVERMAVLAKCKPKHASSRVKPHLKSVSRNDPRKKKSVTKLDRPTEAELVHLKDVDTTYNSTEEKVANHRLSTIEESLCAYGSDTLQSDDKTLTRAEVSSHPEDNRVFNVNSDQKNSPSQLAANLEFSQSPHQPKINTWTTSSSSDSHTAMPPVYQKFLDEVGDGPLTDDLLQCLAEELISLDERDVSISPCPDVLEHSRESSGEHDLVYRRNTFPEVKFCHDNNI